jgi:hypothetical protein
MARAKIQNRIQKTHELYKEIESEIPLGEFLKDVVFPGCKNL